MSNTNYRVKAIDGYYYPQYKTTRKQYYLFGKKIEVWNNYKEFEFGCLDGLGSDRLIDVYFETLKEAREYLDKQTKENKVKIYNYGN
jgi:hypothetical protein